MRKTKTTNEAKLAAAEAFFDKYEIPPLSDDDIERIEAEWRSASPKKKAWKRGTT